jgi:large subunit ribosomal protein L7/L12
MFVPLPVLIAVGVVFLLLIVRVVRPGRRDPLMGGLQPAYRATKPAPVATLPADTEAEVRALLAAGRKIDAIKLARDVTHLGLRETKELVESMER